MHNSKCTDTEIISKDKHMEIESGINKQINKQTKPYAHCPTANTKTTTKSCNVNVSTGQLTQVLRRLPLVRDVWASNPEPIKSSTRC